jgi:hypothetical protein
MTPEQLALVVVAVTWLLTVFISRWLLGRRSRKILELTEATEEAQKRHAAELVRIRDEAQKLVDERMADLQAQLDRTTESYHQKVQNIQAEVAPLRRFAAIQQTTEQIDSMLNSAMRDATALRSEAEQVLQLAKNDAARMRAEASTKADDVRKHTEAILSQATRDAVRMVADARARAEQIGGDAYRSLTEKDSLESAIKAARNIIDEYGDRYVVPTRSVLDDLAADYGHTEAGLALQNARDHSRRMVIEGLAAECDYAEANRRGTAIRFVVDAFNGRVDAILSRAKHDNVGTLRQEITDAASIVNLNGEAFRNARITQDYIAARQEELRWAVVVQELKMKEREEQRRIQEQIREEEKARKEYERAIREAQRDEESLKRALEKARLEVAQASADQRAKYEAQMAELNAKLAEAEARNQRAKSMAEQTRAGHVYVISNIGSFGEDVFKIGMTRRLEPMDRIRELGDASVPFEFDVHAMIYTENAPSLERELHELFDANRINKVNDRKEFFRVPISRLREFVANHGLEASFTMVAEAHEYRESMALDRMSPAERGRYHDMASVRN